MFADEGMNQHFFFHILYFAQRGLTTVDDDSVFVSTQKMA